MVVMSACCRVISRERLHGEQWEFGGVSPSLSQI